MFSFIVNIPLELLSLWKMEGVFFFLFFLICLSLAEYHWQNYNFELGSKNSFLIQLWTIACLWSTVRCLFFLFTGYINEIVHTMLEHVDSEKIVLFCFIIREGEIPLKCKKIEWKMFCKMKISMTLILLPVNGYIVIW